MELETANLIRKMQKAIDYKEQCLHNIKMAALVPHFVSEKTDDERQNLIMKSIHKLHKDAGNKVCPDDKQDTGQIPIADLGMQKFKLAPVTGFKPESSPMGKSIMDLPRTQKSAEIEKKWRCPMRKTIWDSPKRDL